MPRVFLLLLSLSACLALSAFSEELQRPQLYAPTAVDEQLIREDQISKNKGSSGGGISFGGIKLDDSAFYDIPREKCSGQTKAKIVKAYRLKDQVFLFQTKNGYGVAEIEPTLKELETGVTRRGKCILRVGNELEGEIDCRGVRVVKRSPYKNCAYEIKVWSHSNDLLASFDVVEKLFKVQFGEYRKSCTYIKKKELKDRLIKF